MVDRHRRTLLRAIGCGAIVAFSGCVFGESTEAGSIVIRNDSDNAIVAAVSITKVSDSSDDTRRYDEEPEEATEPIWVREYEYEVAGDERHVDRAVVDEPGAYYVHVTINGGERGSNWLGLYQGRNGLAEDEISISVDEDGRPTVSTTHRD